jgi:phosphoribosylaminoimidazole carboxylase PurE protein
MTKGESDVTQKVLILLGSSSDLPVTEAGTAFLKELQIPFSLRISSAHRTPDAVHKIVGDFEAQGGQVFICVAGMSAHLAGVVASLTLKPVIAVPTYRPETAGLDSLLSMGQMPQGIPVSTMGLGKHGFTNGALTAAQILALSDKQLEERLKADRAKRTEAVLADDAKNRQEYRG